MLDMKNKTEQQEEKITTLHITDDMIIDTEKPKETKRKPPMTLDQALVLASALIFAFGTMFSLQDLPAVTKMWDTLVSYPSASGAGSSSTLSWVGFYLLLANVVFSLGFMLRNLMKKKKLSASGWFFLISAAVSLIVILFEALL